MMNSSGSTNRIDGTDLSLLIIVAFFVLLFGFLGFRNCCKRKRSSGKSKALQRHIKKSNSKIVRESSELLKEAPQSFEEEFNIQDHLEDNKVSPSSSKTSRNTKKVGGKHQPPSPDSSSPKTGDKSRSSGKQNKKDRIPKYQAIFCSIFRKEADIESGKYPAHELSEENLPTTSRMDKQSDSKKDAGSQGPTLKRDASTKEKTQPDQQKLERSMELSEIRPSGTQKDPASPPTTKSAIIRPKKHTGNSDKDNGKKGNKRIGNTHSECTGSGCKKCKPYVETSDENKIASEENEKLLQDKVKLEPYASGAVMVQKSDAVDNPVSPNEDYVMIDSDESTTADTSVLRTSLTTTLLVNSRVEDKMEEKVTHCTLASKNTTPDLKTNEEFSYQEVKKTDPEPMDESYEEVQVPSTSSCEYIDGTKEALPEKISHRKRIESIGNVYDILEYAFKEWKGETTKAEAIRKGYSEIPKRLGFHTLRVIRGDNYCAIRATLFQGLVKKLPILAEFGNTCQNIPTQLLSATGFDWIMDWNFGTRFHVDKNKVCEKMEECLRELSDLVTLNSMMANEESRVIHLLSSLNHKPEDYELRLMEAVKFLMLVSAIKLHKLMSLDKPVPVFAIILFARDTSPDARRFMMRHLNAVGDTGGLEQVEMYLLGYTLGITIRVVRPFHFGKPDFIASYPDDMPVGTPMVTLVAEDDRHYNVLS